MSGKAIGWAFDQTGLSKPLKFLLVAACDHADHAGAGIYPGIPLLATKTEDTERNVKRLLRELEATGHLEVVHPGGGKGRRKEWRAPVEKGDILATVSDDADGPPRTVTDTDTVTSPASNGDIPGTDTVTTSAPNSDIPGDIELYEPSPEPSEEPLPTPAAPQHTDPWKIATVVVFGEPDPDLEGSRSENADNWGLRMRLIAKAQRDPDATPEAIIQRANRLLVQWGPGALTVPSLTKHWQRFGTPLGGATRADRERLETQLDDQRRRAELAEVFATLEQEALDTEATG